MTLPISVIPAKPRVNRKRRGVAPDAPPPPPPPPPAQVTVTAVTTVPGNAQAADFFFSRPVTCDGGECPAIVMDMGGGIIDYPRTSEQLSATAVRFFWVDDFIDAGDAWSIDVEPTQGLDLHGATMPVPQAGTVQ